MTVFDARRCSLLDGTAGAVYLATALAAAGPSGGGATVWLPLGLGLLAFALIFAADDRLGRPPCLPGTARHDIALAGATLLALSPWLLAFADVIWRPHLVAGQFGIGIAILTQQMADLRDAPPGWAALLVRRSAPPPPAPPPGPTRYASGGPCVPLRGRG